jgi:oligopeptide/dipeptide ABC transporter ATP-binding protein
MCEAILVLYLGRVVETGPVAAVLGEPRHPYTRALVAARPKQGRPVALAGEPVSPVDPPAHACLFHSRCPFVVERCLRERPHLRPIGGRLVACHRAEEFVDPQRGEERQRRDRD